MNIYEAKNEVLTACHQLVEQGLVARTWGNISCRIDNKYFAITPSGIGYERLSADNIVVVRSDSLEYEGDIKPSSEKRIHAAIYCRDPKINFIIHTHQLYASCISISGFENLKLTEDETNKLGGSIGLAPYALSGTHKLTQRVIKEFDKNQHTILMANHGAVLTGSDRTQAFNRAFLLEKICHNAIKDLPCFDDMGSETENDIHSLITEAYPKYTHIMLLQSENVHEIMRKRKTLPAILDDFAQIIGEDIKTASKDHITKKLKGRNAVYVKDLGILCCAENKSDCRAMLTLTEKNALAYLNAILNDDSPKLSFLDKKIMRHKYTKKYSAKYYNS